MQNSLPAAPHSPRRVPPVVGPWAIDNAEDQLVVQQAQMNRQADMIVHLRALLRWYTQLMLVVFFVGLGLGGLWAWVLFHLI